MLDAMAEVPRERFLPKALRGVAYADEDLPLPDGGWLIEPVVLARLIQAAGVREADVVLVIGCSTGYAGVGAIPLAATVILVQPEAAARADREAAGRARGRQRRSGGQRGSGRRPSEPGALRRRLSRGLGRRVPPSLFEQIGETGRIVAVVDDGRIGKATLFTKLHGVVGQRELFDAQIPPCPGLVASPGFAF